MLRLSRKVDYGLAFLSTLAERPGEWVALSAVAEKRRISPKFLSQLAVSLRGAGIIDSREGVGGGYKLKKQARQVRIKDVVEALEGNLALVDCLAHQERPCPIEGVCIQKPMWRKVQGQLDNALSKISLSDLAVSGKKARS